MEFISIFNDVLGPVMRGPSSSHTAGSFHIGTMARSMMDNDIASAEITFDPSGSYAQVYRQQGVDLAFATGLMGLPLTDEGFLEALGRAEKNGLSLRFHIAPLESALHPNTARLELESSNGRRVVAMAESTGGGGIRFTQLQGSPVVLTGKAYEVIVFCGKDSVSSVQALLDDNHHLISLSNHSGINGGITLVGYRRERLTKGIEKQIAGLPGVTQILTVDPVYFVEKGEPLFSSAAGMVALAQERGQSLGELALDYEAQLLGLSKKDTMEEMIRRFHVMCRSVSLGFEEKAVNMQLLSPSAQKIKEAEEGGRVAVGGIHTRAAVSAMAAMHCSNSMGVVCAAPTGGAAGVIPGVMVTLDKEMNLTLEQTARALFAASAVGLILARRATFAAEVAGCQVEIGAAGAMATAAVVEVAGGDAEMASHAAAIAFQNTMGSVCDLVQGMCEIPCHTRNAVAASSAFVNADLVLGGYQNPIPLDETIDAVYAVGKMLPRELRCTVLGGLSVTPSALCMKRLR